MYTLLVKNVDGSYVSGGWPKKPDREQLAYEIGGMYEAAEEQDIITNLLMQGYCSVEDSACTTYELSEV